MTCSDYGTIASVALAFMVLLVGGNALGETRSSRDAGALRVMTYNIHHGEGTDGKVDLDRIAAVIRAARADIVCLQEVDRDLPRTQHLDFPKLLAEKLGMTAVFEPNYHFDGGDYGNATLTNLPVVSHENLKLPTPPDAEPRGCLRTTIRASELTLDVLNAHLGLDEKQREEQTSAILKAVRDVPTILASDMNETAAGPGVGAILARLRDAAEENAAEKGNTIPAKNPERRIDFIFVSKDMNVPSCDVLSTPFTATASDHLPCIADVNVRAPRDKDAEKGVYNSDDKRVTEAISEGK